MTKISGDRRGRVARILSLSRDGALADAGSGQPGGAAPVAAERPASAQGGGSPARRRARTLERIESLTAAGDSRSPLAQNLWLLEALQDMHRYAEAEGLDAFAAHLEIGGDLLMDEIRLIETKTDAED